MMVVGVTIAQLWRRLRDSYHLLQRRLNNGDVQFGNMSLHNQQLWAELDFLTPYSHHRTQEIQNISHEEYLMAVGNNQLNA